MSVPTPLKKGFKFPIYPSEDQKQLLERTFGCCRFVYNKALAEAKYEYNHYLAVSKVNPNTLLSKPDVSGYGLSAKLPVFKSDLESLWLNEVSSVALQQTMLHLGHAFKTFFRERKGYPAFKKKHNKQSFSLMKTAFTLRDGVFRIAKIDTPIKVVFSRELPSEPSSVTITKTPSGKYYASFTCEYQSRATSGTGTIGIDLGIKDFATLSTSEKISNPKHLIKVQRKLKRLQQALVRKRKGSANRNKARQAVAKLHECVANTRRDFHHQLSRRLVNENQVIGLEKLMVRNMVKNRKLSKHIADAAWKSFTGMVEYKTVESHHCTLVYMDAWYPSSHLCNVTHLRLDRKLSLSERSWDCPHCGQKHDRDVNAALNIRDEALYALAKNEPTDFSGKIILARAHR